MMVEMGISCVRVMMMLRNDGHASERKMAFPPSSQKISFGGEMTRKEQRGDPRSSIGRVRWGH